MKIAIAGTDHIGLSNAVLLVQHNKVIALDLVAEKVSMLNNRRFKSLKLNISCKTKNLI